MKRFLILFTVLFFNLFLCAFANANANLEITKYQIGIDVSEDKTLNIFENIDVNFKESMHGLYRTLPKKGVLHRKGEKNEKYKAKIKFIYANTNYSIGDGWDEWCNSNKTHCSYTYTGKYKIKLGDPYSYVNGHMLYKINYLYKIPLDKMKDKDDFYFNIIGEEWENPILNVEFLIRMPKNFDSKRIYFYDKYGNSKNISYSIKNNMIIGKYNSDLRPGEALTIHVLLPEGYFVKSNFKLDSENIANIAGYLVPCILPFIMLIIVFFLWLIHGRDKKTYPVINFNPPDNLGPLEIAYIYKQEVEYDDVPTLLIQLANKEYLQIEEIGSDDFIITKIKDYKGDNSWERDFFDGLFDNSENNMITKTDLINSSILYKTTSKIIKNVKKSMQKVIFDKSSIMWQKFSTVLMVISWIVVAAFVAIKTMPVMVIPLIVFPFFSIYFLSKVVKGICLKTSAISDFLFEIIWSFFTSFILGLFILTQDIKMFIPITVTILCIIAIGVMKFYMTRWTIKGNQLYGKVLGFRTFLEKVEIDKLQMLVDKDPKYFYNIIPYAYVFGLEKSWFRKFAKITCPPPAYYSGNIFSVSSFSVINSAITSVGIASMPSSSGGSIGGFGGGGGCGGGGHGGGGGGGW